mgnify:CR=1 FL=1
MIIVQGEVYLEEWHVAILKKEPEFVRDRYRAVARTLACKRPYPDNQERSSCYDWQEQAPAVADCKAVQRRRHSRTEVKVKSRRPHTSPRRTPAKIENRVVKVREATGFGPEQLSNIVNESLAIENRKQQDISKTTAYNILTRHGLVEAKKQMMGEYTFFEWGRPDELVQAD